MSSPAGGANLCPFSPPEAVHGTHFHCRNFEQKSRPELKGSRRVWLKYESNLSSGQRELRDSLAKSHLKTSRAYQIRLAFQDLYDQPSAEAAADHLQWWYFWAIHSRLEPVIAAAKTVKCHWYGVLRWFDNNLSNGLIEGINSLGKPPKRRRAATAQSAIS